MIIRYLVLFTGAFLTLLCEEMKKETDWATAQHVTSPAEMKPTQAAVVAEQTTTDSLWLGA